MNHLAHFFLSCQNEDLMIGNFVADYIRNKEVANFSAEVQQGIRLHRKIDTYTDQHPVVKQGTRRLQKHHNKYAPVILDVLYDYLLVNNWERYSEEPLVDFTQNVYHLLEKRFEELPAKLQKNIPTMISHDWLRGYGRYEGLRFTFEKMDLRTSFPSDFQSAVLHLQEDEAAFTEEFNLFFPDLVAHVEENCDK